MSAEYFWFTACYALVLVVASLAVFTHRGQRIVLSAMRRLGIVLGLGAFGLLRTFGHRLEAKGLSPVERAGMAESYIAEAEVQTLLSARVTVWVLISGCVFTALSGGAISGILPPFVDSGAVSFEGYGEIATWLVRINVAGGLLMGTGLLWWLARRTVRLNRSDGCVVTRDLVLAVQGSGLESDLRAAIDSGAYPLLNGLLIDVA